MELSSYRALGRSGLVVSPMALGAMTFGTERWGASDEAARAIFDAYVDAGGNFIDTADVYAAGRSEDMLGKYVAERKLRDRLVLGTKFTWNLDPGNPNAGGNGRKNIYRALDASLRRLRTDYVDLYWLHFWDMVTPVDEVLQTMGDLVRIGKVRYFALSDVPAWYMTKMTTLATERGVPAPVALQTQYSLVERTAEREHVPAARDAGVVVVPWSPLAGGFLAGKYKREEKGSSGEGRLSGANPFGDTMFTDRNWRILDKLKLVAGEVGRSPAEVALAWAMTKPGVSALIIGATKPEQLQGNLASLDLGLTPDQLAALDRASEPEPSFPYSAFEAEVMRKIFGGAEVEGWQS